MRQHRPTRIPRLGATGPTLSVAGWAWRPDSRGIAPTPSSARWSQPRLVPLLAGAGLCILLYAAIYTARVPGPYPLGDFFALWSYGQVAAAHGPALLYDMDGLHAAQLALGQDTPEPNPYPYPPHAILLLIGLAPLAYGAAAALWLAGGLALFAAALAIGQKRPWMVAGIAAILPATAVNLAFGQGGCLIAALLIGGVRLLPARPVLAGLLFAVLTIKPQFGLLLPVALVAGAQWRCIAATIFGTLALAAMATIWQGPSIWTAWLDSLPAYQAYVQTRALAPMPTVDATLRMLGASAGLAGAAQAGAALAAAAATWVAWRSANRYAIPVLLAATPLATPHGFAYDLPLLAGGIVLHGLLRPRFSPSEAAAFLAALALPALLAFSRMELPIAAPVLLLCLASVLHGAGLLRNPFPAPRPALEHQG